MGLFGRNKKDKGRYKSKKELKPLIKQAESDAKKQNMIKAMSKAAVQAGFMGAKAAAAASPKFSHGVKDADTEYMPIADREYQTTDEEYYDRGDYERSYGPQRKYGHPEMPSAAQKGVMDADTEDMPINTDEEEGAYVYSPANKRMGDMVAKVYGKALPPSHNREHTKAEKKHQKYTTYGMPDNLYTEYGQKISTAGVDEGNLSGIHRVHKDGEYVTVQDDTQRFRGGTKLFLNNPLSPGQNGGKGRAKAKADAAKRKQEALASKGKKPKN